MITDSGNKSGRWFFKLKSWEKPLALEYRLTARLINSPRPQAKIGKYSILSKKSLMRIARIILKTGKAARDPLSTPRTATTIARRQSQDNISP